MGHHLVGNKESYPVYDLPCSRRAGAVVLGRWESDFRLGPRAPGHSITKDVHPSLRGHLLPSITVPSITPFIYHFICLDMFGIWWNHNPNLIMAGAMIFWSRLFLAFSPSPAGDCHRPCDHETYPIPPSAAWRWTERQSGKTRNTLADWLPSGHD